MTINTDFQNVTGEDIGKELHQYGIAVVGVGAVGLPPDFKFKVDDIRAFFKRRDIRRATPFLIMPTRTVFCTDLVPGADKHTRKEVRSLGWRYVAAEELAPEVVHERIVSRLEGGHPVTLIRQTAKALRLDADDLRTLPLSKAERFVLNGLVLWTRLRGKPLLICLDLDNGRRRCGQWTFAFYCHSPVQRFARVRRLFAFVE